MFKLNRSYRGFEVSANGFYYRSKRDKDIEKFKIGLLVAYTIYSDYRAGIEYNVYNFDDFLTLDRFYTGNIVRVFVQKNITF